MDNVRRLKEYFPHAISMHMDKPPKEVLSLAYIDFIQSSFFGALSLKNKQYFVKQWKAKVR